MLRRKANTTVIFILSWHQIIGNEMSVSTLRFENAWSQIKQL